MQRWLVRLLSLYSDAYAGNQFRALQQLFRWLAEEEQVPDPMPRLSPPKVSEKLVPVFISEELSALEKTCQGRSFAQRRFAAIIAVLTATGIRAGELAGIRYDPHRPHRARNLRPLALPGALRRPSPAWQRRKSGIAGSLVGCSSG